MQIDKKTPIKNPFNTIITDLHQQGVSSPQKILIALLQEYTKEPTLLQKFSSLFSAPLVRPYLEYARQALINLRNCELVFAERLNTIQAAKTTNLVEANYELELVEFIRSLDQQISSPLTFRLNLQEDFANLWVAFFRHYPYLFNPSGLTFYSKEKSNQPESDTETKKKSELVKCWIRSRRLNRDDLGGTIKWLLKPASLTNWADYWDEIRNGLMTFKALNLEELSIIIIEKLILRFTADILIERPGGHKVPLDLYLLFYEVMNSLATHRLSKMLVDQNPASQQTALRPISASLPCLIKGLKWERSLYESASTLLETLALYCPASFMNTLIEQLIRELNEDDWIHLASTPQNAFLKLAAQNHLRHFNIDVLYILAPYLPSDRVRFLCNELWKDYRYKCDRSNLVKYWTLIPYLPHGRIKCTIFKLISHCNAIDAKFGYSSSFLFTLERALPCLSSMQSQHILFTYLPTNVLEAVAYDHIRQLEEEDRETIPYHVGSMQVLRAITPFLPTVVETIAQVLLKKLNPHYTHYIAASKALTDIIIYLPNELHAEFKQRAIAAASVIVENKPEKFFDVRSPVQLLPPDKKQELITSLISQINSEVELCITERHTEFRSTKRLITVLRHSANNLPQYQPMICTALYRLYSKVDTPKPIRTICMRVFHEIQNLMELRRLLPIGLTNMRLPKDLEKSIITNYIR